MLLADPGLDDLVLELLDSGVEGQNRVPCPMREDSA
jgi:hypothetical protein